MPPCSGPRHNTSWVCLCVKGRARGREEGGTCEHASLLYLLPSSDADKLGENARTTPTTSDGAQREPTCEVGWVLGRTAALPDTDDNLLNYGASGMKWEKVAIIISDNCDHAVAHKTPLLPSLSECVTLPSDMWCLSSMTTQTAGEQRAQ